MRVRILAAAFGYENGANLVRQLLLCDIPDEYQSVRDYLKDVKRDYPYASWESIFGGIAELERFGALVAGCVDIGSDCWRLPMTLGFGRLANLIFVKLRSGDFLAVHAFSSETSEQLEAGCATGILRKEALE